MRPAPDPATAIGVDVGGTRIRAARIDRGGAVRAHLAEPSERTREGFAAQLRRLVGALRDDSTVAAGVGLPGRVDGARQRIVSAGYLDIAGLDVAALLRPEGLRVRIENDATMALIAEARGRAASGPVSGPVPGLVFMVTIGTGIGGAAMQGGVPWYGGGFAGQFGHLAVAADGPPCNCGRMGCVETFSSGTALDRLTVAAGWPAGTPVETLLALADAGRADAAALLAAWAAPLERALQSLVAMADPDTIVIGGGLGQAMTRALARLPRGSPWFELPVVAATLGDRAGVIGAALAAFDAGATA